MRANTILLIIILGSFPVWSSEPVAAHSPGAVSVASNEISQMPGFPVVLEQPEWSDYFANRYGLVLADLDGDGDQEVIYSNQRGDEVSSCCGENSEGLIWAWDLTGQLVPGFPVSIPGCARLSPSAGDLDGDGTQEIVQISIVNCSERLVVVNHRGAIASGYPIEVMTPGENHREVAVVGAVPTLYDFDSDGALEIFCPTLTSLHIYEADGTQWQEGWPIDLVDDFTGEPGSTPSVADMDGDGKPEVFFSGMEALHMFEVDGSQVDGWPVRVAEGKLYAFTASAVADLDGDTDLEVIVPALPADLEGAQYHVELQIYHHDGTPFDDWPIQLGYPYRSNTYDSPPVVTDLEGDGELEILIGVGDWDNDGPMVYALDSAGNIRPGFPAPVPMADIAMLTTADIDGDGVLEIFGDAGQTNFEEGYIFGLDANGQALPGFPLRPEGTPVGNGAIIGDVDADGDYEIAVVGEWGGEDARRTTINLYDLQTQYHASNRDWLTFHAVNERGGVHKRAYRGWRVVHAGSRRGGGR